MKHDQKTLAGLHFKIVTSERKSIPDGFLAFLYCSGGFDTESKPTRSGTFP